MNMKIHQIITTSVAIAIVLAACRRSDSTASKADATRNNPTSVTAQSQAAISPQKGQPDTPSSIPAPLAALPTSAAAPKATAEVYTTGTFIDARDGKIYKTVKIGNQTWMAENLKYATTSGSWCYTIPYDANDGEKANCAKYGRLYDWATAKSACPEGWHLPSKDEWQTLIDYLGGNNVAGSKLKSISGWNSPNTGATDSSGFTALPGGFRDDGNNKFSFKGWLGLWWSATQYDPVNVWACALNEHSTEVELSYYDNHYFDLHFYVNNGFSVRCVKD
jgi:uncharacterized protein (TIGR02145 family)